MRLYDECIAGVEEIVSAHNLCKQDIKKDDCNWPDKGKNQLIFRNDMAYELGGDTLPAVSGILLTDNKDIVPEDEVWLCGKDLSELKEDTPYARIALIRVRSEDMGDANAQYQAIRKIEYTRYHVSPKGFMMRISALNQREAVRVSKEALKGGLSFSKVGNLFLQAYHKRRSVEAVKLIFITEPEFPYDKLSKLVEKSENITKTLDHLLNKVNMDCKACSLQQVCAEVETLYKNEIADRN